MQLRRRLEAVFGYRNVRAAINFNRPWLSPAVGTYRFLRRKAQASRAGGRLSPTRFVILGSGRCGSTALVSLLDSLPGVRCDGELLAHPVPVPLEHLVNCCATSGAEVYGFKIVTYELYDIQRIKHPDGFAAALHERGFHILHLTRRNVLEHAVSNLRARTFGFHAPAGSRPALAPVRLELNELISWMRAFEQTTERERRLLKGVPHLSLVYEDDLLDEPMQRRTVARVCEHLGITQGAEPSCAWRKISPRTLRASLANYDEIEAGLVGTPYERFLDPPAQA